MTRSFRNCSRAMPVTLRYWWRKIGGRLAPITYQHRNQKDLCMSTKNSTIISVDKRTRQEFWSAFGKRFGGKGGRAAAANMTPEQLSERGKKAVAAREARRKAGTA